MATFKDPVKCFSQIEVMERLLEIRAEFGLPNSVYLHSSEDLADYLDAYGFDGYALTAENEAIDLGKYRAPLVPNGDFLHCSHTGH